MSLQFGFWPDATTVLIRLRTLNKQHKQKQQSMNASKLFVDLSQPWKQVTEVSITREESIKSHKILEDNTENHSRQKRSFSLESPTKSRPELVRVWIYLRSNRSLR